MSQMTIPNDVYIAGNLNAQGMSLPNACVLDAQVASGANIGSAKTVKRNFVIQADLSTANIATQRKVIYRCNYTGGGTVLQFGVGAVTPFGAASTATIKLLKNGSDILSADITLDNGTAAYVLKLAAGFTSNALVAGDVLELQISAVTGANPAVGFFAQLIVDEMPN